MKHAQTMPKYAVGQKDGKLPRRKVICRAGDLTDSVLFICSGWAASLVTLPNGDRQILSFLLPGDIVSSALLFRPNTSFLVETITEVIYRCFERTTFMQDIVSDPEALDVLSIIWTKEVDAANRLAADLGRRTAEERIARLIINLMERLTARSMNNGMMMEFPIRQHHIADAMGISSVHVSEVLADFRRRKLIRIKNRALEILDHRALQRIADFA